MKSLTIIFFLSLILLAHKVYSQNNKSKKQSKVSTSKTTVNTNLYNPKDTKIYNNYYNTPKGTEIKNDVLTFNKYLDLKKPLIINIGGNRVRASFDYLKKYGMSTMMTANGIETALVLKWNTQQNKIEVNSEVRSVDQKIFSLLKNSKLIVSKGLYQNSSDRFLEIVDDYNIPVLQIILDKPNNEIIINGVFFSEDGAAVATSTGIRGFGGDFDPLTGKPKPFALMSELERNKVLMEIREYAKNITSVDK